MTQSRRADPSLDRGAFLSQLEALVAMETPSSDLAALRTGVDHLTDAIVEATGIPPERVEIDGQPHLLWRQSAEPDVLLLGHLDTVWPLGTITGWPFTIEGDRATGPGIFDMKAGLVQMIRAVAVSQAPERIALLITTDEETGSATSRSLIEAEAQRARAVLVAEPSAAGALKVARKGVSLYRLVCHGRASHAGLEPERGVNALMEMSLQVPRLAMLADPGAETTVTPTVAQAGTTVNTVPARAELDIDVRCWTAEEQARVDDAMNALLPQVAGSRLELLGGINRPPLERAATQALADRYRSIAASHGSGDISTAKVGGGSDGNFTGALGVQTLDGLGAVGGNAHSAGEWIDIPATLERTVLLCHLVADLVGEAV